MFGWYGWFGILFVGKFFFFIYFFHLILLRPSFYMRLVGLWLFLVSFSKFVYFCFIIFKLLLSLIFLDYFKTLKDIKFFRGFLNKELNLLSLLLKDKESFSKWKLIKPARK